MTILKKGRAFHLVMRRTTTGEKWFYIQCTAANADIIRAPPPKTDGLRRWEEGLAAV